MQFASYLKRVVANPGLMPWTDELSDHKMNMQHTEEGFRGTLLAANVSSEVV